MARKFNELRAKMKPAARERSRELAAHFRKELALDELRIARSLTQEHIANAFGVKQSHISKIERRADMYLSTLQSFVKALGGHLELKAVFPEGTVHNIKLREIDKKKKATA